MMMSVNWETTTAGLLASVGIHWDLSAVRTSSVQRATSWTLGPVSARWSCALGDTRRTLQENVSVRNLGLLICQDLRD